jgi:hypothetical protein
MARKSSEALQAEERNARAARLLATQHRAALPKGHTFEIGKGAGGGIVRMLLMGGRVSDVWFGGAFGAGEEVLEW